MTQRSLFPSWDELAKHPPSPMFMLVCNSRKEAVLLELIHHLTCTAKRTAIPMTMKFAACLVKCSYDAVSYLKSSLVTKGFISIKVTGKERMMWWSFNQIAVNEAWANKAPAYQDDRPQLLPVETDFWVTFWKEINPRLLGSSPLPTLYEMGDQEVRNGETNHTPKEPHYQIVGNGENCNEKFATTILGDKSPSNDIIYNNTNNKLYSNSIKSNKKLVVKDKLISDEDYQSIIDYWNEQKLTKFWMKCRKLSPYVSKGIKGAFKLYTLEEIIEAIDNYSLVLQSSKYYWDYIWSIGDFFNVGVSSSATAPRKWWKFLEENFTASNYLDKDYVAPEECNLKVLKRMLIGYRRVMNTPDYQPSEKELAKFSQGANHLEQFCNRRSLSPKEGHTYLFEMFDQQIFEQSQVLYPGHFSSKTTWDQWMPHYLNELGITE